MARLTPEFSAGRAIREYTDKHYLPASASYLARAANDSAEGVSVCQWRQHIAQHWGRLKFGSIEVKTHDGMHFFRVQIYPGELSPCAFKVELYAGQIGEGVCAIQSMSAYKDADPLGPQTFLGEVSASRPATDYTPRIVPYHKNASVPLEASEILWQR
jgi:starch phosphorylase